MTLKSPMWTLDEGVQLVRIVQPMTRKYNFHVAIGGGTVNVGHSNKDLDLYFLPLCNGVEHQPIELLADLEGQWGKSEPIGEDGDYEDDPRWFKVKFMVGFPVKNRRIDVFIWK